MTKEYKSIPFTPPNEFAAEEKKLADLKKSEELVDKLTALLMEPHTDESFTDRNDCIGLWYHFARPKAIRIMKEFNVSERDPGSQS